MLSLGDRVHASLGAVDLRRGGPELLNELYIRRYKNLESLRVSLAHRVVVHGQNGVGKTNLLEALALVAGSDITSYQVARRAVLPGPGDIEVVSGLNGQTTAIPWTAPKDVVADWWMSIGVEGMLGSWPEGIKRSSLPDEIKGAVVDPSTCALRYSLVAVEGLEALSSHDRGVDWSDVEDYALPTLRRSFLVALCVPRGVGEDLRSAQRLLPTSVRPLVGGEVDPDPGDWVDVLAMPPASQVPFQVCWLVNERSDHELWADCSMGLATAATGIRRLTSTAEEVLDQVDWSGDTSDDSDFLASWLLTNRADAAIRSLAPHLLLDPDDDGFSVEVDQAGKRVRLGGPGDQSWMSRLSSGERVLVDEALLDALDRLGQDCFAATIASAFLASARDRFVAGDDALLDLQMDMQEHYEVVKGGFWTHEDLDLLLSWARRTFEQFAGTPMPNGRLPVVRVFDEPERHLHPLAQQRLAEALRLRKEEQIIVSSHSPTYLELRGWTHVSLTRSHDGVHANVFDPMELEVTQDFARGMGLQPADLLNLCRYVLIVEGPHDKAFLDGYAGNRLRGRGVLIIPMHGIDHALQLADLNLLGRLGLPAGTLVDHGVTKAGKPRDSKESREILKALKLAKSRGRHFDDFRLERPDIIAYINDNVMREEAPDFPGFRAVESRWMRERDRDYKQLASEMASGYKFHPNSIRELARRSAQAAGKPPPDLTEFLAKLEAAADSAGQHRTPRDPQ